MDATRTVPDPAGAIDTADEVRRRERMIRIGLLAVVAVLVLSTAVAYMIKVEKGRSAILRWQPIVIQLTQGVDVYEAYTYPNPPIMGLCLWPIMVLPPAAAAMLFFAMKVAMATQATIWSIELARGRAGPLSWAWIAAVVALCARMFMSDLQHGNVNIVVVFVVLAALRFWVRGQDRWAGLALALGIAFKVTPALFVPYFLYKRQWRIVGWTMAGLVLFLLVIPGAVLGPARNVQLLTNWGNQMIMPFVVEGEVEYTGQVNQSIPGLVHRLMTDSVGVEQKDGINHNVNLVSLDEGTAAMVVKLLLLGCVGLLALFCRTPTQDRQSWQLACEFGLVLIAMLLLSERSWKHHYVTMVLPYACVATAAGLHVRSGRARKWLAGALIASFLLMLSTARGMTGWVADGHGHKYFLAYGAFLWSAVVAFVALAALLLHERRELAREPAAGQISPG